MQLSTSQLNKAKEEFIKKQNHKCCICQEPISMGSDVHLDHCHQTGKVRGVLHRDCNTLEGILHSRFVRSGLRNRGVDYHMWLTNLVDYLQQPLGDRDYHPSHVTDQSKIFAKLVKHDQLELLGKYYSSEQLQNNTKSQLVKLYRKTFKNNPRCDFDNQKYNAVD